MRVIFALVLISGMSFGQDAAPQSPAAPASPAATTPAAAESAAPAPVANPKVITIPTGTKIPLSLAQAISTKNAREGDAVYATTAFPFVVDNRVVVPAGSYVQGKISHVERAGHGHGRAEILMHFTSIIFPSGYTVMLPASVENTPGADNKSRKGFGRNDSAGQRHRQEDRRSCQGRCLRDHGRGNRRWSGNRRAERSARGCRSGCGGRDRVGSAEAWRRCEAGSGNVD